MAKEAQVERMIGEVVAHFGHLGVLVNNDGVPGANKPTHEITEAAWDWGAGHQRQGRVLLHQTRLRPCA